MKKIKRPYELTPWRRDIILHLCDDFQPVLKDLHKIHNFDWVTDFEKDQIWLWLKSNNLKGRELHLWLRHKFPFEKADDWTPIAFTSFVRKQMQKDVSLRAVKKLN